MRVQITESIRLMIKASNTLSVNIILEKQQAQLKVQHEENYKSLKTVSALSSENSMLRSKLQKKSDTIVSQNKKSSASLITS